MLGFTSNANFVLYLRILLISELIYGRTSRLRRFSLSFLNVVYSNCKESGSLSITPEKLARYFSAKFQFFWSIASKSSFCGIKLDADYKLFDHKDMKIYKHILFQELREYGGRGCTTKRFNTYILYISLGENGGNYIKIKYDIEFPSWEELAYLLFQKQFHIWESMKNMIVQ